MIFHIRILIEKKKKKKKIELNFSSNVNSKKHFDKDKMLERVKMGFRKLQHYINFISSHLLHFYPLLFYFKNFVKMLALF